MQLCCISQFMEKKTIRKCVHECIKKSNLSITNFIIAHFRSNANRSFPLQWDFWIHLLSKKNSGGSNFYSCIFSILNDFIVELHLSIHVPSSFWIAVIFFNPCHNTVTNKKYNKSSFNKCCFILFHKVSSKNQHKCPGMNRVSLWHCWGWYLLEAVFKAHHFDAFLFPSQDLIHG